MRVTVRVAVGVTTKVKAPAWILRFLHVDVHTSMNISRVYMLLMVSSSVFLDPFMIASVLMSDSPH